MILERLAQKMPEVKKSSASSSVFGRELLEEPKNWKELQNKVALLFRQAGYGADIEHDLKTVRGDKRVDVYVDLHEPLMGPVICECKYWGKRIPQNEVHAFRTVVHDSGASEGILISKCGFQRGAREAASMSNVKLCTWREFLATISDAWIAGRVEECLVEHAMLQKYLDPFDMPTHMLDDGGRTRYTELFAKHFPVLVVFNKLASYVARSSPSPYLVKRDSYVDAFARLVDSGALSRFGDIEGIFEHLLGLAQEARVELEDLFDGLDLEDCPYDKVCDFAKAIIGAMGGTTGSIGGEREDSTGSLEKARLDTVQRIMWDLLSSTHDEK